jgi:transcriptional/translational regulatory protein YebC/TACO1
MSRYEFTRNDGSRYEGNTVRFDFRKNGNLYFDADEIQSDPVLKRIAKRLKVEDGALEVMAADKNSAFRKFFGVTPENSCDLDEEIVPSFYEGATGWYSHNSEYEIIPEFSW